MVLQGDALNGEVLITFHVDSHGRINHRSVAINGNPTTYASMGPDACTTDGHPEILFCFTTEPQPSNLTRSRRQQKIVESKPEPALTPSDSGQGDTDFATVVDQYLKALSSPSSETVIEQRCMLGEKLMFDHGDKLDKDTRQVVKDQISDDDCFG